MSSVYTRTRTVQDEMNAQWTNNDDDNAIAWRFIALYNNNDADAVWWW